MTPFLQAVSTGNFRIMQEFISKGADVKVVDNIGNNCLHLAVRKEEFHTEDESLTVLDKYYKKLQLSKEGKLSSLAVACYLADNGANFYHRNVWNVMPLDLINDTNLKERIKALFPPPLCLLCKSSEATVTFQPCEHTVTCKDCCSENEPKNCPKCQQVIVDKRGFGSLKLKEIHIQKVANKLGSKWRDVGENLGIGSFHLNKIKFEHSNNSTKQSLKMLRKWSATCAPEEFTFTTLREALLKAECLDVLEYQPQTE
ncbi:E3 ubiquitin-protein ligase MIB2-like [Octopus sinensis]|uniref:E3 ubiquitin-protein ligase MIB2-like n=1 Tax=Octopus sinensis TaxID=2607531 RepID=A0A7E6FTA0_9MOLL|nr:E3 ubiquitin-protein ligase MIB2-like [Octopus sinensis]